MKKTYEILEFEDKQAANGKEFTRFKTNEGWMSCFDTDVSKQVKQCQHDEVVVLEVSEVKKGSNTYFNIMEMIELKHNDGIDVSHEKILPRQAETSTGREPVIPRDTGPKDGTAKNCELMTAKDIFCNIWEVSNKDYKDVQLIMTKAIQLVKQARDGLQ